MLSLRVSNRAKDHWLSWSTDRSGTVAPGPVRLPYWPSYHVISYSRRYHHLNAAPEGTIDYSYGRHVDDLISLIRALRRGPAHLVGHSYGATVAALVALERPEMVSSLVLGEPSIFSILSDSQDKVSLRLHRVALRVVQKLSENDEQGLAIRESLNIVVGREVFDELPLEDLLVINQNVHTLGPMLRTYFEPTRLDCRSADMLSSHVVRGEFPSTQLRELSRLKTASGKDLIISQTGELRIEGARLLQTDILARNGVIHVIDRLLLPVERAAATSA